jgi:hypothetical protein
LDGHRAGSTPLTIQVPRTRKPILVQGSWNGAVLTKQIVPDRDQTLEFP